MTPPLAKAAPDSRQPAPLRSTPWRNAGAVVAVLMAMAWVAPAAMAANWDPVAPADLAATACAWSPGADVEILLSRMVVRFREYAHSPYERRVESSEVKWGGDILFDQVLRTKIYSPKGVADRGMWRIEVPPNRLVVELSVRVVKPDGRIIALGATDFAESTVAKTGSEKWQEIRVVFPDIATGDVIDVRCIAGTRDKHELYGFFIEETSPVREYEFSVESFPTPYSLSWSNCDKVDEKHTRTGIAVQGHNLPPFEEESLMPPLFDYRGWLMLVEANEWLKGNEGWKLLSDYWKEEFDFAVKGPDLKRQAAVLMRGAASDNERLQRLYDFAQREISNLQWIDSAAAIEANAKREQKRDREFQPAGKTFETKQGRPAEIAFLFAGLAKAAGFEVRRARTAPRAAFLHIDFPGGFYLLRRDLVAVKVGGQWQFFNPGAHFVPFGMVPWNDEGVTALLCDGKKTLVPVPGAPAKNTLVRRTGHFELEADGTLAGGVTQEFSGHAAVELKNESWAQTQEEIDRKFRTQMAERLPAAEISEIHWEHLKDHELPVVLKYQVRVPGFAEAVGQRLILAPGFFEVGRKPLLPEPHRRYPIFFQYARAERDEIEIVLPSGFRLESPGAPGNVGEIEALFGARYEVSYLPKKRIVRYVRDFAVGGGGMPFLNVKSYPTLKRYADKLHESDSYTLILRRPLEDAAPAPGDTSGVKADTAIPTKGAP